MSRDHVTSSRHTSKLLCVHWSGLQFPVKFAKILLEIFFGMEGENVNSSILDAAIASNNGRWPRLHLPISWLLPHKKWFFKKFM